ncbi:MAG: CpaE family protein, partial [Acidimicrobiia bacterium]
MPSSAILLVETDPSAGDVINSTLVKVGYTVVVVTSGAEAIGRASDFRLLVIDVLPGPVAVDLCREVRGTPALSALPILCVGQADDVDERIRFLEAGADDVMARPFDARELEARVEALLLRFQRTPDKSVSAAPGTIIAQNRRMIAAFSPKGGVGTTTVAVNVATATALRGSHSTLLVDLALQWGQASTHLNIDPKLTIADLVRDGNASADPDLLRSHATAHASGLWVLAAPGSPDLAELMTPVQVARVLRTALDAYDRVVVDAGSVLDERVTAALELADRVVLTVSPEISALKAVLALQAYLQLTGSVGPKTAYVLNQVFARELVKLPEVEALLGARVTAELPYDAFVYLQAANEGIPVVQNAPRSAPSERLMALAANLFGDDVP